MRAYRAAHLKDFDSEFLADAAAGRLPAVTFYKPQGNLNQHPGYANLATATPTSPSVIATLEKSPQWPHMLVVVTYDENGGFWDHARGAERRPLGPGDAGAGDHRLAVREEGLRRQDAVRHRLDPALRDAALESRSRCPASSCATARCVANGQPPMGDLSAALEPPR